VSNSFHGPKRSSVGELPLNDVQANTRTMLFLIIRHLSRSEGQVTCLVQPLPVEAGVFS
jgi:hypothetical protein